MHISVNNPDLCCEIKKNLIEKSKGVVMIAILKYHCVSLTFNNSIAQHIAYLTVIFA